MVNRLAREASPYLQQHAHNPVDWFPWGPEALDRAKSEDKPILLSIGYSACHWCHVMERESFEDPETAKLMNELFVAIKVDREERPDLDQIYQLTIQLMGKSGGWPLTVFLTPDQRPFYAGTYYPREARYGMPNFRTVLRAVAAAYADQRPEIEAHATRAAESMRTALLVEPSSDAAPLLSADLIERAASRLGTRFDEQHGGFGRAPKFPNTMALDVLLRRGVEDGGGAALARVTRALDGMRAGGVYDQLGGGFHRYSTDEKWLVPHFEKMLYDNALLLRLYVDGWRATGRADWADTARETFAYVAREMTDARGGFYASQDADSEGEEGKFFVWSPDEIAAALAGDEEALGAATLAFGVTDEGNFEETGKTVLSLVAPGVAPAAALARAKEKLLAVRERRIKPFRDEKILASWNALMISALADAALALDAPAMLQAAERAFAFLEEKLLTAEGRVQRLAKDDVVKGPGFLDDHAYVANAALDLYEATGDPRYVARARAVCDVVLTRFAGFYFTPDDGEPLLTRAKDPWDHAVPSGQSMAFQALLRLGALASESYAERARRELEGLAKAALGNPFALGRAVCVLDRLVRGSTDVVVVGPRRSEATRALVREAFRAYVPNRTIAWLDPSDAASRAACALLAEGKEAKPAPVAYVCRGRACSAPCASPAELASSLRAGSHAGA